MVMSDSNIRSFGEFEKKVITAIKKLDDENSSISPLNILSELDEFRIKFAFDDSNGFKITYQEKLNLESDKDFIKATERNLCSFVLLMEYLIKEEYLFEIKGKNPVETNRNNEVLNNLEKKIQKTGYEQDIPIDSKVTEKLEKIWKSYFICTHKLNELVNHDFLERSLYEERQNNKHTRRIAKVTIFVTAVSALTGIVSCIVSICANQKIDIQKISDSAVLSVKQVENENLSDEKPVLTAASNQTACENSTEPAQNDVTEPVGKIETNTQTQGELSK